MKRKVRVTRSSVPVDSVIERRVAAQVREAEKVFTQRLAEIQRQSDMRVEAAEEVHEDQLSEASDDGYEVGAEVGYESCIVEVRDQYGPELVSLVLSCVLQEFMQDYSDAEHWRFKRWVESEKNSVVYHHSPPPVHSKIMREYLMKDTEASLTQWLQLPFRP